jgi:hypothetical protein
MAAKRRRRRKNKVKGTALFGVKSSVLDYDKPFNLCLLRLFAAVNIGFRV